MAGRIRRIVNRLIKNEPLVEKDNKNKFTMEGILTRPGRGKLALRTWEQIKTGLKKTLVDSCKTQPRMIKNILEFDYIVPNKAGKLIFTNNPKPQRGYVPLSIVGMRGQLPK